MLFAVFALFPPVNTTARKTVSNSPCTVEDTMFSFCVSTVGGGIYFNSPSHVLKVKRSYFNQCRATSVMTITPRSNMAGGGFLARCKSVEVVNVCFYMCQSTGLGDAYSFSAASKAVSTVSQVCIVNKYRTNTAAFGDYCNHIINNFNCTIGCGNRALSLGCDTKSLNFKYNQFIGLNTSCVLFFSNGDNKNSISNCNFIRVKVSKWMIESAYYVMQCINCSFIDCVGEKWGPYEGGSVSFNGTSVTTMHQITDVEFYCVLPSSEFTTQQESRPLLVFLLFILLNSSV